MGDARPRLVFLCQNLPYPPDGGALIRSYHTLRLLAEDFDITALCFYRGATRSTRGAVRSAVEGLADVARVRSFPIPQERSRVRLLADHALSVLTRRAYTRWTYESKAFRRALREALGERPVDLVHMDSLDLVAYLPALADLPVVLAHHNIESRLLARRATAERGWRRRYLRLQARLTRREERAWTPRMALNVVVSPDDGETLEALAPEARWCVVPNGVDTRFFTPEVVPQAEGLVFVGGYTWFPNRDGMEYFASEILPLIRRRAPDVEVTWVGRASDEVRRRYESMGIRVTGYVDDIRPHVRRAACFVVPLRVGGGTRLKILDAWALGKAVVSTSRGCEGLEAVHRENILVADDPAAFASSVLEVLEHPGLRRRLERGARATAEGTYDWEVIGRPMRDTYRDLLLKRGTV